MSLARAYRGFLPLANRVLGKKIYLFQVVIKLYNS